MGATILGLFSSAKIVFGGIVTGIIGILLLILKIKNVKIKKQEAEIVNEKVKTKKSIGDVKTANTEKSIAQKLQELSKEKERKIQKIKEKENDKEKPNIITFGNWN